MNKKVLLTSFTTWLPHQKSNSSDDLLHEVTKNDFFPASLITLRNLPVDVHQASTLVIQHINQVNPDLIINCGMAEKRKILTLESQARCENNLIETRVNLEKLIVGLKMTNVSHDAGKFVCEGLYYSMLKYLRDRYLQTPCIFVHVPVVSAQNLPDLKADFSEIITRLLTLEKSIITK
ncbi:peptidase C15 [[Phormidium ambiguum] IAM M-71]|uniref:Peptidase C15 n=1 Tax=[Phormidium ambiguum] IAM M-71 TaxID=454136 RepID=A0A1U7IK30_9CYAN|nr:peptidase C15 [Phormidium ambiguum]OKH37593.1 peptidase C15 [Phormidium ambiguum IAM M-71]